jgi:hypothetical protein
MAATDLSPNSDNYTVYTGILKWTPEGGSQRDCGNVSEFALTITPTRLPHFNARGGVSGVSFQDSNPVIRAAASVAITMDEITAANLQLALLAGRTEGPPIHLDIFTNANVRGAFELDGTNVQGAKVKIILPSCSIAPSAAIGFINPTAWAEIKLTAEVYGDPTTGSFGTLDWAYE